MDITMPNLGGLETLERLRAKYPQVKVILLSVHCDSRFIHSAIALGADGYVLKNGRAAEIVTAIRAVTKGGSYFSPVVAREIFQLRELWNQIEGLDNGMPASVQASMLAECGRLIERGAVWFLREEAKPLDVSSQIESYAAGVQAVGEGLETLLSEADCKRMAERAAAYVGEGAPEEVAASAARLPLLAPACDIVRIARDAGVGVGEVGAIYFAAGSRLGFDWLRRAASHLPSDSAWDKLAITAIIDDLYGHQSDLTRRVIEAAGDGEADETAIDRWAEGRRSLVSQTEHLLAELQSVASPNLSMLAVANRQLKSMSS